MLYTNKYSLEAFVNAHSGGVEQQEAVANLKTFITNIQFARAGVQPKITNYFK